MKTIINISKIILILFLLSLISIIIVAININNTYDIKRVCRSVSSFNYDNYQDLNGVQVVELKSNCDKISLYVLLESNVKEDNIYAIILQIEDKKKMYNDDDIFEIYLENENLKYLIIIDKNETIDIDYVE